MLPSSSDSAPSQPQAMTLDQETITVRQARERFFDQLRYADGGGYEAKLFRIQLGAVSVPLPNLRSRVEALRFHDLHHVATGYQTDLIGEAEVGAWELASGCRGYWAAWLLNFMAFVGGLALAPRRVFRAFVRGRRSRNLYRDAWDDALLDQSLGELRLRLRLELASTVLTPSRGDRAVFAAWVAAAVLAAAAPLTVLVLLLRAIFLPS